MKYLDRIISETIQDYINEVRYDNDTQPHNSKTDVHNTIGINPLTVDVGGHSSQDVLSQPSTIDFSGESMNSNTEHIFVSDNKFLFYKVKNFGNPDVKSTMNFFKKMPDFRAAIDTINGAAVRSSMGGVYFRTISPESLKDRIVASDFMIDTFWEFSYNKEDWYIVQPNPTQKMRKSGFKNTPKPPIQEAADREFSIGYLHTFEDWRLLLRYCRQHLGEPIGKGSSRYVFQIDDRWCLKVAYNRKGIAQNNAETEEWKHNRYDIFAKKLDYDRDGLWVVAEYVLPANAQDFKHCIGMTFKEFKDFINTVYSQYAIDDVKHKMSYERMSELSEQNETLHDVESFLEDTQEKAIGDMSSLRSWGLTMRDGKETLVLMDYGLTEEIWKKFYDKKPKNLYWW